MAEQSTGLEEAKQKEKIDSYLQILENVETELLYSAQDKKDIQLLIKTKAETILSLLKMEIPYVYKNDLVYVSHRGRLYSIPSKYLLSLESASDFVLKENDNSERILPTLFLHKEGADINQSFISDALRNLENQSTVEKVESKNDLVDSMDPGLSQIFAFDINDYNYNFFTAEIFEDTGEILMDNIKVLTYLVEDSKFIAILSVKNGKKTFHQSYFCLEDGKNFIEAEVKNYKADAAYTLKIFYDKLDIIDKDTYINFTIASHQSNRKTPNWKDIYAFPYSISENSRGGILIGKSKSGYETYKSDFKNGKLTIRKNDKNNQKTLKYMVYLLFQQGKVIGKL